MSRSQLVGTSGEEESRFFVAPNEDNLHPAMIDLPKGIRPVFPGSEGLVRLATVLVGTWFRVASVDLRDAAWNSSQEDPVLAEMAMQLVDAIGSVDQRRIGRALSAIARGVTVESIELSHLETARRVRVTRTGSIETSVANEADNQELVKSFEAAVNKVA